MKFATLTLLLFTLLSGFAFRSNAQDLGDVGQKKILDIRPADVIRWEAVQALSHKDGTVVVGLRLSTEQQFSIYKKRLVIEGPAGFIARVITEAPARLQEDPMGEGQVEVYDGGDFEVEFKGDAAPIEKTFKLHITSLGCTHKICLFPYTQELQVPVFAASTAEELAPSAVGPADSSSPTAAVDQDASATDPAASQGGLQERYAEKLKSGSLPFWLVLLVSFLGGIATNLTPCVFPMIPITLRLLARQGQSPLAGTSFYAAGIVLTYSSLGIVASLTGGFFGSLLAHPAVNVVFGLIFLGLGFTMLGFGDFSRLQNLGAQFGSGKASHLNALGMGAGAGLVAAPCTGPIMGALLAYAAQQQSSLQALSLFVIYSLGFALPYLGLGLVAHRATAFKLSPKVQVAVKLVFAAAMVGLAAYYLKNPAYKALESLRGHWKLLSISLVTIGIVLVGSIIRSAHLMLQKSAHLLPSLVLGLGFFASIQWLSGADLSPQLQWIKHEDEAFALAAKSQKPVFIDGWADWCVACKELDQITFHDPAVIEELSQNWILLKLDLTELTDTNEALAEKYGMQGLPTLLMLPQDGRLDAQKKIVGFTPPERLLQELKAFPRK